MTQPMALPVQQMSKDVEVVGAPAEDHKCKDRVEVHSNCKSRDWGAKSTPGQKKLKGQNMAYSSGMDAHVQQYDIGIQRAHMEKA